MKVYLLATGKHNFIVEIEKFDPKLTAFAHALGATEPMPPALVVARIAGIHEPPFWAKPLLAIMGKNHDVVVYEFDDGVGGEGYEIDWSALKEAGDDLF